MATTGETVTFGELEARANRLAHLYRDRGLRRGDHVAIFMENNARYLETEAAAERTGLYYTCINSYLTPDELAYIVNDCRARILIFDPNLPRLPTGKLYKRVLQDRYWAEHRSRIV